jgi:hypothetical protein
VKKIIVLIAMAAFVYSCEKDSSIPIESSANHEIRYLSLSELQQKQFWKDRIDRAISLGFPENEKQALLKIQLAIGHLPQDSFFLSEELKTAGEHAARILSEENFLNLFIYQEQEIAPFIAGDECNTCIASIQAMEIGQQRETTQASTREVPDCNCNWFCPDAIAPCEEFLTSDDGGCNEVLGCGFLLLGPCTGIVVDSGEC